jgi:type II secretory pathway pseudopilin PulG
MFPQEASERLCARGGACPEPADRVSRRRAHQLVRRSLGEGGSPSIDLHSLAQRERAGAFTLLELLIVIGIIAVLMVLLVPAFTNIKSGTDVTNAAYTIKGVLDTARTYAKANNTYTWVGFYEENGSNPSSPNSDTPAVGRVIMSIVASKDGTKVYTSVASPAADMDPSGTRLAQVGKLVKLDNVHLRTFSNGTGAGDTFPARPSPSPSGSSENAKIGDTSPPDSLRYFHYPPSGTEAAAQYTFKKMIQFSPRGECRPQNDNYEMRTVIEVGVQPIHGTVAPALDDPKNCAIQLTGFDGDAKIYQR